MKKILFSMTLWLCATIGFSQYYFNKAAKFTTGSYYSSVNQSSFNVNNGITIEAWIYMEEVAQDMMIVGKNFQTAYGLSLREVSPTEANIRFNMLGGFASSTGTVKKNEWTHIAVTYNNAGVTTFYINGVQTPNSVGILTGPIPSNTDAFLIGADHFGGSPNLFFRGQIDEVHIWDGVRSGTDIAASYHIPLGLDNIIGLTVSQTHSFRMNMKTANDTLFSECFPHQAMVPHNITLVDYSNKTSSYIDYNNYLTFDGTSGMSITYNSNIAALTPGKSITVESWVRLDASSPGTFANIFNQSGGTNEYPWAIYASTASGEVFFETNGGTTGVVSGGNILDGRWHHVAATCDDNAGKISLYVDGRLIGTDTFDPGTESIQQTTKNWFVGTIGASSFATNKFKGGIDEVRLWKNTVRTQEEIQKYMYVGLDDQINDPDIDSLFVFSLDGVTRQTNVSILKKIPVLYGSFTEGLPVFASSKANNNATPTSPLLRLDPAAYPNEFTMGTVGRLIPDLGSVSDTITISGKNTPHLASLEVAVLLNHVYVSDVEVMLYSPAGDSVMLANTDASGCNGNDLMTIFSATADVTYDALCNPLTYFTPSSPTVKPSQNLTNVMQTNPDGNWRIRVYDKSAGLDGYLHAWGLRMSGYASIEDVDAGVFKTYNFPNPASNTTTIYYELPQNNDVKISVFDQTGKMVQQHQINNANAGENNFVVDVSNLSNGMYYYQITAGNHQGNNKIIVNK